MKQKLLKTSGVILAALGCMLNVQESKAQFTKGNLVILRVGNDTATALNSSATAAYLDQITPAGALVNSFAIPVTGAARLTMSGSSTSEGQITRKPDGTRIIVAGYDTSAGIPLISLSASATVSRAINEITPSGVMARSVESKVFQNRDNMRSAASTGTFYWAAGGSGGTTYYGKTDTPAVVQNTVPNTRVVNVYNNNLYFSTASTSGGGAGIYKVGTGLPRTSGQTLTTVALTGLGSSPYAFVINKSDSIMYVADDRTSTGGGIQKFRKSVGGTYTLVYTLKVGTSVGARGLCVDFTLASKPVLYATTTDNKVVKLVDSGSTSVPTVIFTAQKNRGLRGIQFAPVAAACVKPAKPGAISGTTKGVCNGVFRYSIAPVTGATSYQWTIPAGSTVVSDSGTVIRINVTTAAAPFDSISVVAINRCGSSLKTTAILSSIPVKPVISGPACVTANQIGLKYSVTAPVSGETYRWNVVGGTITAGQNTSTITVRWGTAAGNVIVRAINLCADTIYGLAYPVKVGGCTTALARPIVADVLHQEEGVSIYPNPAASIANIALDAAKQDAYSITLTDLSGKQVYTKTGKLMMGKNNVSLSLSQLRSGTYIANIRTSEGQKVMKVVKL